MKASSSSSPSSSSSYLSPFPFPSPSEQTVAEALLLLSSTSAPSLGFLSSSASTSFNEFYNNNKIGCNWKKKGSSSSDSNKLSSSSSSLTSDGSTTREVRADRLRVLLAVATRFFDLKLKVVKRTRSKHYRNSDHPKSVCSMWRKPLIITRVTRASMKATMETSLTSSSASSAVYSVPSRVVKESVSRRSGSELKRQKMGSGYLKRRAEAIMKLLSDGRASEVKIRQVLGDSPDTSKALRMLLKMDEVKRCGAGGSKDPYIYMVAESPSEVDSV